MNASTVRIRKLILASVALTFLAPSRGIAFTDPDSLPLCTGTPHSGQSKEEKQSALLEMILKLNIIHPEKIPVIKNRNLRLIINDKPLFTKIISHLPETLPLDSNTVETYADLIKDYSNLVANLDYFADRQALFNKVREDVIRRGPTDALLIPTLEIISLAYQLEEDSYAIPAISIVGRMNPTISTILLQNLDAEAWRTDAGYNPELPDSRDLNEFTRNVLGADFTNRGMDVKPHERFNFDRKRVDAFFKPIWDDNFADLRRTGGRLGQKLQSEVGIGFGALHRDFVMNPSRSPFYNLHTEGGAVVDKKHYLMESSRGNKGTGFAAGALGAGSSAVAPKVTREVTAKVTEAIAQSASKNTINSLYTREAKAGVAFALGFGSGMAAYAMTSRAFNDQGDKRAAAAGALMTASVAAYQAYNDNSDPHLIHRERMTGLNEEYRARYAAIDEKYKSQLDELNRNIAANRDKDDSFLQPVPSLTNSDTLEAQHAREKLALERQHEIEKTKLNEEYDKKVAESHYKLDMKQADDDQSNNDAAKKSHAEEQKKLEEERQKESENLEKKQAEERKATEERQSTECKNKGGCDESVTQPPEEKKPAFDNKTMCPDTMDSANGGDLRAGGGCSVGVSETLIKIWMLREAIKQQSVINPPVDYTPTCKSPILFDQLCDPRICTRPGPGSGSGGEGAPERPITAIGGRIPTLGGGVVIGGCRPDMECLNPPRSKPNPGSEGWGEGGLKPRPGTINPFVEPIKF